MRNLYRKKAPKRTLHESNVDLLRLNEQAYKAVQGVAGQWLGYNTYHESLGDHPPTTLLRNSLERVRTTPKHVLPLLIHDEQNMHNDHTIDYHSGGGLWDTSKTIFRTLWNLAPISHVLMDLTGQYKNIELSDADRLYAEVLGEAYKKEGREEDFKGLEYDPAVSTEKVAVYRDPDTQTLYIGVRGTTMNTKDLLSDVKIMAGNTSGHEKEVFEQVKNAIDSYDGDWKINVSGHSLGGLEVMNLFTMDKYEMDESMQRVDRVNLFNPGLSPTLNLSQAKEAADNDKFNFYLNTGDVISNTMIEFADDNERTHIQPPSLNPLSNHSLSQWE